MHKNSDKVFLKTDKYVFKRESFEEVKYIAVCSDHNTINILKLSVSANRGRVSF